MCTFCNTLSIFSLFLVFAFLHPQYWIKVESKLIPSSISITYYNAIYSRILFIDSSASASMKLALFNTSLYSFFILLFFSLYIDPSPITVFTSIIPKTSYLDEHTLFSLNKTNDPDYLFCSVPFCLTCLLTFIISSRCFLRISTLNF